MAGVSAQATIATQWTLTALSLFFVMMRCFARVAKIRKPLGPSDYLIMGSWIFVAVIAIIDTLDYAISGLKFDLASTVSDPEVVYEQKIIYVSIFMYDTGLYLPKFSFLAFYYDWISFAFPRLRIALYGLTFYSVAAFLSTLLVGLLWCNPVTQNWDPNPMVCHVIFDNRYGIAKWMLNVVADLLTFILPFFLLPYLKVQRRTFYAAILVFLFGFITIAATIVRFVGFVVNMDPNAISVVSSLELNVSIIVTCLPSLKFFLSPSRRRRKSFLSRFIKRPGSTPNSTLEDGWASMHGVQSGDFAEVGMEIGSNVQMEEKGSTAPG